MNEEEQYNTTFNYLMTHIIIPRLIFSDLDLFYKEILTNPQVMQSFMQTAAERSAAVAEEMPEVEPPYRIDKFNMGIYPENQKDESVIWVEFPKFENDLDCTVIVFPIMREKAGYYTGELSTNPLNGERIIMLGEWQPAQDDLKHVNYGEVSPPNLGNILDKVINIAYERQG